MHGNYDPLENMKKNGASLKVTNQIDIETILDNSLSGGIVPTPCEAELQIVGRRTLVPVGKFRGAKLKTY
ncbi:hypothetical protein ABID59_003474 [Bradyrhizobium sp. S3.3.6]|uniref:Uncharacterized protein n=1 Tax=Bradyrhizobium cytisi TaxID=515489 RepID=A0A5S4WX94_9BRAD|nr:hypothetical protein [Bradyrhizobium cytisi]TYL86714.1 hypothetical protein FXB38_05465 [Bradyrhizobium cytisi]